MLQLDIYDGKSYVVLADRSSAPPLARQVLQLLMDQSGGSLPWMELCSRYKTTFGVDPDLHKIKEELLDYVQVKFETHHEKTCISHMRRQRHRSAAW